MTGIAILLRKRASKRTRDKGTRKSHIGNATCFESRNDPFNLLALGKLNCYSEERERFCCNFRQVNDVRVKDE